MATKNIKKHKSVKLAVATKISLGTNVLLTLVMLNSIFVAYSLAAITFKNIFNIADQSIDNDRVAINEQQTAIQYEYITFAINEDYAQRTPDWQDRAFEIINFVNSKFAEDTKIQYRIAQFKTYPVNYQQTIGQQLWSWFEIGDMHYVNKVAAGERPFSTTVLFTVIDSSVSPNINDLFSGGHSALLRSTNNGTEFLSHQINLAQDINPNFAYGATILGENVVNSYWPDGWRDSYNYNAYENQNYTLIHELGHSFGLGLPENYLYNGNIDNSGASPELPSYNFSGKYGLDSMGSWLTNMTFNEFNAAMINSNLIHQRDWQAFLMFDPTITVKVIDPEGRPFRNARVRIYGARTGCIYCESDPSMNNLPSPLLKTYYTNSSGVTNIIDIWNKGTGSNSYVNYIVKVDYNNETAGDYLSQFDVQYSHFFLNSNHELFFRLNQQAPIIPFKPSKYTPMISPDP